MSIIKDNEYYMYKPQIGPIVDINCTCSLYSSYDCLEIKLTKPISYDTTQRILALANRENFPLRQRTGMTSITYSRSLEGLDDFFTALEDDGMINSADRYQLKEVVKEVDYVFMYRSQVKAGKVNQGKKEIIIKLSGYYIETLVNYSQKYEDIILLIQCLISPWGQSSWQKFLKMQKLDESSISESLECLKDLTVFINGEARLATAFLHYGVGLPTIEEQREIIIEQIKTVFDVKFGATKANRFVCFYIELSLTKLRSSYFLLKPISNQYFLDALGFPVRDSRQGSFMIFSSSGKIITSQIQSTIEKYIPSTVEEAVLKKYHLKRFPISISDMDNAKADETGNVLKDPKTVIKSIDGKLFEATTQTERLYGAIVYEEIDVIREILDSSSFGFHESILGGSLLVSACKECCEKSVKVLLECGAEVDGLSEDGGTALHVAAWIHSLPCLRVLINSHADPSIKNTIGRTPLHQLFACDRGKENVDDIKEMIQLLTTKLRQENPVTDPLYTKDCSGDDCFNIVRRNANLPGRLALEQLGYNCG